MKTLKIIGCTVAGLSLVPLFLLLYKIYGGTLPIPGSAGALALGTAYLGVVGAGIGFLVTSKPW